jgi:formylglycine-generating enzyme required for sulfatase activity
VYVSWEDAKSFCAWLSEKEGKTYRLPTDREWTVAVGLGRKEKWRKGDLPVNVQGDTDEFPWGRQWPPPPGAGNYSDQSRKAKAPQSDAQYLEGYDDGFPTTAPVMSLAPNEFGLYDLGGNVWEWVEDWWNAAKAERVLRGGGCNNFARGDLLSSHRNLTTAGNRSNGSGFRVVLVVSGAL